MKIMKKKIFSRLWAQYDVNFDNQNEFCGNTKGNTGIKCVTEVMASSDLSNQLQILSYQHRLTCIFINN